MSRPQLLLAGALVCLAGCSALVGGNTPTSRRCVPSGSADPCAHLGDGSECRVEEGQAVGECVSPRPVVPEMCGNMIDDDLDGTIDEGAPEVCDQADNDCDMRIDEEIDLDGDGFAGCVGSEFFVDCDDNNPEINPGDSVVELCDGVDNDCDVETLDGAGQCTGMQVCQPPEGCTDITCRNSPSLCDPMLEFCDMGVEPPVCRLVDTSCLGSGGPCGGQTPICDPDTGTCVAPQPDGAVCDTDAMCESRLCVESRVLRLTREDMGGDKICARTCCLQSDCLAGETCWDSGSGSRVCIPSAMVAADPPTAAPCSVHSDCDGMDLCRSSSESVHRVADRLALTCAAPEFSRLSCSTLSNCTVLYDGECSSGDCYWDRCGSGRDCPTGLCAENRCREPCGTATDCLSLGGLPPPECIFVSAFNMGRADTISVCDYQNGADVGTACSQLGECRSETCTDDLGRGPGTMGADLTELTCRRTCCKDSQCESNEQCRPAFLRGRWESMCLPRRQFGAGGGT